MQALVVDDSRAMRAMLSNILQAIGIEVVTAPDGEAALSLLGGAAPLPDVTLLDWHMPGMNGLEVLKHIRARDDWRKMFVMMVTTESEHDQMMRALLAGADEYLIKPFGADALLEKLQLLGIAPEIEGEERQ